MIVAASGQCFPGLPYQEMLGGVFDGHPWHEEVEVGVCLVSQHLEQTV